MRDRRSDISIRPRSVTAIRRLVGRGWPGGLVDTRQRLLRRETVRRSGGHHVTTQRNETREARALDARQSGVRTSPEHVRQWLAKEFQRRQGPADEC
jgi:hypothetical protein